jgi:hypothetical protein
MLSRKLVLSGRTGRQREALGKLAEHGLWPKVQQNAG